MCPLDTTTSSHMLTDTSFATTTSPGSIGCATQKTLAAETRCSGVGVHSGQTVNMRLMPAPVDTGIIFIRTDLVNGARTIPARWDYVVDTQLCTVVGNEHGGKVATIEHLMAAFRAMEIDNAIVEIDGPEVPVMDGSAAPFVFLMEMIGTRDQSAPRREIAVLKTVEIEHAGRRASLAPANAPRFTLGIAFPQKKIARQDYDFNLSRAAFKNEIGRARTFGFFEEVEQLHKMGLGRGGSLDNAIVVKDAEILNEGGLRYQNEFVRHKLLDAIGDLALAGAPIRGHFQGECTGHAMNNRLLRALFADPSAWCLVSNGHVPNGTLG